jgi:iron complex outermembrane recepter protein
MSEFSMMKWFVGASSVAMAVYAVPAVAQEAGANDVNDNNEIVVSARRRDESAQDVPLVVNAVTAKTIDNLQIKKFEDIASVVPGLTLARDNTASSASLRGVNFNAFASGNNATVEFYLNDTPVASQVLFQTLFDPGQIEVLRGPQGTLRGRASPSGSITVTTRRPDLTEFGATGEITWTSHKKYNGRAAVNFPIVQDVLAVRFAGMVDDTEGNRTRSLNDLRSPHDQTAAGRVSVLFTPTDTLTFNAMYQYAHQSQRQFTHVESANIVDPTQPASPVFISAYDYKAVQNDSFMYDAIYTDFTWGAEWKVAGQKLNYVGGRHLLHNGAYDTTSDAGNVFDNRFSQAALSNYGQLGFLSRQLQTAHELRLSSDERVAGMFDYVVGVFQQKATSPTNYTIQTPVFLVALPFTAANLPSYQAATVVYNPTRIGRTTDNKEQSIFGNVTAHIGDKFEISGGIRHISYKVVSDLFQNGVLTAAAHEDSKFQATIYSASAKYRFNDDLMVYASFGTSWRPGLSVVGDFSLAQSALERSFLILPPETSKSFEIGFKSSLFDKRLRFNATFYHQTFQNYPYRANSGVPFVNTSFNQQLNANIQNVALFNFVAPVPAKVDGVEVEATFQATPNWSIGANLAYANGRFTGSVPCNDYAPKDGVPDAVPTIPTLPVAQAAAGANNLLVCNVSRRASDAPRWTGTIQSEFHTGVSDRTDVYLRGFATVYGDSLNDEGNPFDDVPAYALVNAFVGVRDKDGTWDLSLFVRNLLDTKRVLNRGSTALSTGFASLAGSQTGISTYRSVNTLEPREVGVTFKASFGSR